jgi:hypothetical protein
MRCFLAGFVTRPEKKSKKAGNSAIGAAQSGSLREALPRASADPDGWTAGPGCWRRRRLEMGPGGEPAAA